MPDVPPVELQQLGGSGQGSGIGREVRSGAPAAYGDQIRTRLGGRRRGGGRRGAPPCDRSRRPRATRTRHSRASRSPRARASRSRSGRRPVLRQRHLAGALHLEARRPRSCPGRPGRPGPRWSGSRRGRSSWPGAGRAAASCADAPRGRPRCRTSTSGQTNRTIARMRRQRCGVRFHSLASGVPSNGIRKLTGTESGSSSRSEKTTSTRSSSLSPMPAIRPGAGGQAGRVRLAARCRPGRRRCAWW